VPGQGEEAYEHLLFMAAAAGARYCPPCRWLTFPGKGAPVKDRTEAFDRLRASQERHVARTRTPLSLRLCSRRREREGRRAIKTARTSWWLRRSVELWGHPLCSCDRPWRIS
jgi:hypothetical protein